MIGELDKDGNLQKYFVYGAKNHAPDYFVDNTNNRFKIITDHLGSVRFVLNSQTGEVKLKMNHDEFGKVLADSNPNYIPFGFAGGIYDSETKLVRFGVRDYDPRIGRWTSKDPIRFKGGDENLYGYVIQDPVNLIDPSGKCPLCGAVAIGAVIGGGSAVFGSYLAGTLNQNNAFTTFTIGASAGAVSVIASGAIAASVTSSTLGALFGAELGSGTIIGTAAGIVTDLGFTILTNNPDPSAFKNGIKKITCGGN